MIEHALVYISLLFVKSDLEIMFQMIEHTLVYINLL